MKTMIKTFAAVALTAVAFSTVAASNAAVAKSWGGGGGGLGRIVPIRVPPPGGSGAPHGGPGHWGHYHFGYGGYGAYGSYGSYEGCYYVHKYWGYAKVCPSL